MVSVDVKPHVSFFFWGLLRTLFKMSLSLGCDLGGGVGWVEGWGVGMLGEAAWELCLYSRYG